MTKRDIWHYILSFFLVISILVSVAYVFAETPIPEFGNYTVRSLLSSVGVSVGVSENPANSLAQALRQKEKRLDEKAASLTQKEKALEAGADQSLLREKLMIYMLIILNFLLFVLILLNFYFDKKERGRTQLQRGISRV